MAELAHEAGNYSYATKKVPNLTFSLIYFVCMKDMHCSKTLCPRFEHGGRTTLIAY